MGVEDAVLFYGENLYEDTKGEGEGQTQLVLVTFLIDSPADIANYNLTDLYREWKIGDNDMGLLVVIFYQESEEDGITYKVPYQVSYKLGTRMEAYVTTIEVDHAIRDTINVDEDPQVGALHLYVELARIIYDKAYADVFYPLEYTVEELETYLDTYVPIEDTLGAELSMSFFSYLLSPNASWLGILGYGVLGIIVFGAGGGFILHLGKGGSSGGKGGSRRL